MAATSEMVRPAIEIPVEMVTLVPGERHKNAAESGDSIMRNTAYLGMAQATGTMAERIEAGVEQAHHE